MTADTSFVTRSHEENWLPILDPEVLEDLGGLGNHRGGDSDEG